jgi:hypothetical protein
LCLFFIDSLSYFSYILSSEKEAFINQYHFTCRTKENTHKTVIRENAINPDSIVKKNDRINYHAAHGKVADSKILTFQTENTSLVDGLLNFDRNQIVIILAAA